MIKASSLLVLEGEKDVDSALKLGFVATTNAGGAGKWRSEYNEALWGKDVTVICDADAPGVDHGRSVAEGLRSIARQVRLIEALPQAKDLSAWVELGGTREQLLQLIAEAPRVTPTSSGIVLTSLSDLLSEPDEQIPYLVDQMLPAGGLSLLAGKPKSGKSTLARFLAL